MVINTLNEEKNLPRAIASVRKIADEVVVVDMHSDDRTAEIAKKAGAKVYEYERIGYVEPARNYALRKALSEYILVLDADEELPNSLAIKLKKIANSEASADYYRIPRKNIIFGKWIEHTGWWPDYNIRFFKRGAVVWSEIIHSVPETRGKGLDLTADVQNAIVHHNYRSLEQYLERMNRYTSIEALDLIKGSYKFIWTDLLKKPMAEFLRRYFADRGYKDGAHGLALSLLQAFSELILYIKVWQNEKFKEQHVSLKESVKFLSELEKDLDYWKFESLIREGGGLKERIRRKLRLL